MSIYMAKEQKDLGRANFQKAVGTYSLTRRDFMKGLLAAGAVVPVSAAVYFGYERLHGNPVKAGLIGAGDEGGVLIGDHNPEYLEFVAVSDIRPSNVKRIFTGEPRGPRKGFNNIHPYGKDAQKKMKVYEDYKKLLEDKDVEAVVIALPLHLHAQVSIEAMKAGKHVLCEKLMAWNIGQCKDMIRVAEETDRILSIGHQRHYSLLYAHALEMLKSGEIGAVRHIRALWHRNNAIPLLKDGKPVFDEKGQPMYRDSWRKEVLEEDRVALASRIKEFGYKSMEELVRWRLFHRTGGGLMAELGSHQLDACSIFLGKVHPLAVSGVGGKYFYKDDREAEDHVFTTFEFPGPNYFGDKERKVVKDKNDIVVVTYSSINTNRREEYGECVMGTQGTMIVQQEEEVYLLPEPNPNKPAAAAKDTNVTVATAAPGKPALSSTGSPEPVDLSKAQARGAEALGSGPPSRGYREEMEHFAYCIRLWNQSMKGDRPMPRCHGKVAMADAIIALSSNLAMRKQQRIEFKPEWFDPATSAVPDADMKPEVV